MAIPTKNTSTIKILRVLAPLDGIEIISCQQIFRKESIFCSKEKTGRFFQACSGTVYEACNKHLPIFLSNLRGIHLVGWEEIEF
jgi:hypothetical protein